MGVGLSPLPHSGPSCCLVSPQLKIGASHPPRNGDLWGHINELQQAFLRLPFSRDRTSTASPHNARCQLVEINYALNPETPKAFHREKGKFVAPFVEGYMFQTSVMLALARLERTSADPSWIALPP